MRFFLVTFSSLALLLPLTRPLNEDGRLKQAENTCGNESYVENRLLVTLTNEASQSFETYQPKHFPELLVENIIDLTSASNEAFKGRVNSFETGFPSDGLSLNSFNRTFRLDLEKGRYESPYEAAKLIEKRPDVLCTSPDFVCRANSVNPNDTLFSSQWGLSNASFPQAWDIT